MTLKDKLNLIRKILTENGNFYEFLLKKDNLSVDRANLLDEIENLKKVNSVLSNENQKLKTMKDNINSIVNKNGIKSKLLKPDKVVIVKYSLYINADRTHIGAFLKDDIEFLRKKDYSPFDCQNGYVFTGLFDNNLCGLLNEYGDIFSYFVVRKKKYMINYMSNIIVYDYLTLPQLLSLMEMPVLISEKGVTVDMIDSAVKFAEGHSDELFNKKIPKRRVLSRHNKNC